MKIFERMKTQSQQMRQRQLSDFMSNGGEMKVRKKPVVVEAELYDGTKISIAKVLALGDGIRVRHNHLVIRTLEGDHRADIGDWIIRGVKGELYPCKPDIFKQTYEGINIEEK